MLSKKRRLGETEPLLMIFKDKDLRWYIANYKDLAFKLKKPLVKTHQLLLGPQQYTAVLSGNLRFWIWERAADPNVGSKAFRVYVNNVSGFFLEVPLGTSPEDAKRCWKDYRASLGYPDLPG